MPTTPCGPPSAAQREWDVLIEHESTARPVAIAAAMRVAAAAHAPSAPLAAALRFSARGGTFASLVQSELLRAQLRGALQAAALPDAARAELMLENINNNSRVALLAGERRRLLGGAARQRPREAHAHPRPRRPRGRDARDEAVVVGRGAVERGDDVPDPHGLGLGLALLRDARHLRAAVVGLGQRHAQRSRSVEGVLERAVRRAS